MNRKRRILIFKYAAYALALLALFLLQSTPRFLEVFGVKPNFVIPAVVCIAMMEGELVGGIYGAWGGLLCDFGGMALGGFNGMILFLAGVAVGLLTIYLVRFGMISFVIMTFSTAMIRSLLDYFFNFAMWGYESAWMVFAYQMLPCAIYTAAVSPLIFYLLTRLHRRCEDRLETI